MFPEVGEDGRMIKILESAIRIIKSSNLNEEEGADGEENPIDSITMDVPLFIRMLEFAREDASTDMDLHDVAEKATALSAEGEILSMNNYEDIVGGEAKAEELNEGKTESIQNVLRKVYEAGKNDTPFNEYWAKNRGKLMAEFSNI
jgi:hypothetical protein